MMCMISPALEAFPESLSTLKFANRAKNIRNVATVNEDVDQRTLLKKYERELRRLRQELAQRSKVRLSRNSGRTASRERGWRSPSTIIQ